MKTSLWTYMALLSALLLASAVLAQQRDVKDQRKELQKIQRDVSASRARLDSLRREEARVEKNIQTYDVRIESQSQKIAQLNKELKQLKANISDAEQQLGSRQSALELSRQRFLASARRFYLTAPRVGGSLVDVPATEMESNRRMIYLTSLINFQSGNVAEASRYFEESLDEVNRLAGQQGKVTKQVKRQTSAYTMEVSRKKRQEQALDRLRDLKEKEADRIAMLQQSAREMEALIARLEAQQKKQGETQPEAPFEPSVDFATLQGKLVAPFRGEITVSYGNSVDPITKLKSFSPGITIQGESGGAVKSVGYGKVAYTGYLRGYGNFVIVNHDNQYYTTYAGLKTITVRAEQLIDPGTQVGTAGDDGLVKFELRKGRQSLNPTDWIRLETF